MTATTAGMEQPRPLARPTAGAQAMPLGPGTQPSRWGPAAILLALGYEWLLSGLNKLLSNDFRAGLAAQLQQAMQSNPNHWYVRFLGQVVLPHAHLVATTVEIGELLVAAGLFAGAGLWLGGHRLPRGWVGPLTLATLGALFGSAVMTANYYLMAGNTLSWLNSGNPFNEGLDIDGLLTLVALALLAVHLQAWRGRRHGAGER